jgi:hypothetical protein
MTPREKLERAVHRARLRHGARIEINRALRRHRWHWLRQPSANTLWKLSWRVAQWGREAQEFLQALANRIWP